MPLSIHKILYINYLVRNVFYTYCVCLKKNQQKLNTMLKLFYLFPSFKIVRTSELHPEKWSG